MPILGQCSKMYTHFVPVRGASEQVKDLLEITYTNPEQYAPIEGKKELLKDCNDFLREYTASEGKTYVPKQVLIDCNDAMLLQKRTFSTLPGIKEKTTASNITLR